MVNNIKELKEQLENELIKNWEDISEEAKKEASFSLATAEYSKENTDLRLRIKYLEQEKNELKKTLLTELAGGVHDTYKNLIAEKEQKIKELEERQAEKNRLIISIDGKRDKLEEELKEKEVLVRELEVKFKEEEEKALTHLDGIKVCEDWYFAHHINPLNKELANKSDLLLEKQEIIEEKDELIKLLNKPLPKTPSKFKTLKSKIKTKFHHLKEKINNRGKELITKIEVKPK